MKFYCAGYDKMFKDLLLQKQFFGWLLLNTTDTMAFKQKMWKK